MRNTLKLMILNRSTKIDFNRIDFQLYEAVKDIVFYFCK